MKREGFIRITDTYKSCLTCRHHDSDMVRSGRHPIRNHFCCHPKATKEELLYNGKPGKYIGEKPRTPNWCPIGETKS